MRKSRTGIGIQMALALLAPPKGKAAPAPSESKAKHNPAESDNAAHTSSPEPTGRWDFSRLLAVEAAPEVVQDATESARQAKEIAANAWKLTAQAAGDSGDEVTAQQGNHAGAQGSGFTPKPMTYEEIRLWLQSFNAGPYALLKYQGDVPFKETKDYVPRVMKYYEQDLSSEYDPLIEKAAKKYGLEPQLIRAVMKTESNFRNDTVSHAGARGLMQVMPVVWKDIKEKYDLEWDYNTQVFEPERNIEVACAYLAWLRYDFLPRHFAAYDRHPDAPTILVRDHDRGVPDRESPRLVAKSDTSTARPDGPAEVASANVDVRKVVSDAETEARSTDSDEKKTTAKADEKPKASADDDEEPKVAAAKKSAEDKKSDVKAENDSSKETVKAKASTGSAKGKSRVEISDSRPAESKSGGKVRVTTRGNGKAIAITMGKGGKVTTKAKPDHKGDLDRSSKASLAKAGSDKEETETQGG